MDANLYYRRVDWCNKHSCVSIWSIIYLCTEFWSRNSPVTQVVGAAEAAKAMSKQDSEQLLAQMVHTGILCIEFGYTAYATNAYLKCSPRAAQVLAGQQQQLVRIFL